MTIQKIRTFKVKIELFVTTDPDEFIIDGVQYCKKIHRKTKNVKIFKMNSDKFSTESFITPEVIEYLKENFGLKDHDNIVLI